MSETFPPREGDINRDRILAMMQRLMNDGYDVYVKWTCPADGERVTCETKNTFSDGGFRHDQRMDGSPCGHTYPASGVFGIMAIWHNPAVTPPDSSSI